MGYLEDHVHDASVRKWNLIEMLFGTPVRLATADFDVVALGQTWVGRLSSGGRPCEVTTLQMQDGVLSAGTLRFADGDNVIFSLLRATNGGEGIVVTVWEAWFDAANATAIPDATRLRASGKIDSPLKDESGASDVVEIKLIAASIGTNVYVPSRLVSDLTKA